jgi:seryl-tRNA synthetase
MHNIKEIRTDFENFKNQLKVRNIEVNIDEIKKLDENNRKLIQKKESLESEKKDISKSKDESLFKRSKEISKELDAISNEQKQIKSELDTILSSIPNIPHKDVPIGTDGSRFVFVKDKLALLERALSNFMLDKHVLANGYKEISPPLIASENTMYGTGQLPKFENDQFEIKFDEASDRKFLIPTAEVILTNIVKDKIVDLKQLPLRFVASTPCFRKEAGSYGKDTKGMIRQHQFYKVELVSIVENDKCLDELERMTNCATGILDDLGLPYRKIILCSGDMGFSAEKTYDIEVWLPSEEKYREISSCSSCSTFQATRMKTRYKNQKKETLHVGTLNGSGLAVGRTLIAVMENYQQNDGSILIPEKLRPYMNNLEKITSN